jgi:hypothetical protein
MIMFKRYLLFAAALWLLAASSLFAGSLLPLQPGNTWLYRATDGAGTLEIRVGAPLFVNGKVYHRLIGYVDQALWVRQSESGSLFYYDEERERESILTSFEPFEMGWFHAPFRGCEQDGMVREKRSSYSGPAGHFDSVLHIQYRAFNCADTGTFEEHYLENLGMLRRVIHTIAGPRTFELVYARLGKMTLEAERRGAFSVTVEEVTTASRAIPVTLRLALPLQPPLRLKFPSSQDFDLVLRDKDGRVLYRWSDGQFFTPVVREAELSGVRTWNVVIPVEAIGHVLREGEYVIEAWLTAGESQREFAASAPLDVSAESAATLRRIENGRRRSR